MDSTQSRMSHFIPETVVRLRNRLFLTMQRVAISKSKVFFTLIILFQSAQQYCHAIVICPVDSFSVTLHNAFESNIFNTFDPNAGSIGSNQTICNGTAPAPLTNVSSSIILPVVFYVWQQSTTSEFSGYSDITGTNSPTYSPGILTQTTWFRRGASYTGPVVYTDPVKITVVNPNNAIITANQTICSGSIPAQLTGLVNDPSFTYQWLSSTTSQFIGFSPAAGINNLQNYSPGALTQTTWYSRVVYGVCPNDTTPSIHRAKITVIPTSVGGTVSGNNDSVCTGTNSTTFTLSGYTGTIQWQSSITSASAGFSNIVGANSSTHVANNLSVKTYYRAIVTSGACPAQTSAVDSIFISAISVGGQVSGGNGGWVWTCLPTNSTTLTLTGYTGNILKWQSCLSSDFSSGVTDISNTTNTLIVTNLSIKTYYRAIVQNGTCAIVNSGIDSISIAPLVIGGKLTGGQTVCSGTNTTNFTLTEHNGSVLNWQWSTTRDFSSGINTISNTSTSYQVNNLTSTRYYRAVIGSLHCVAYAIAYSSIDSIVVIPKAIGGILSGGTTVCSGTNSTLLTLSGHTGSVLKWESSPNAAFSSGVVNLINTTTTYTATNLTATTYFRAILVNSPCPADTSDIDSVVVVAQSVGGTLSGGGVICPGNTTKLLTLNGFIGTILKWQSSPVSDFSSGVIDINNTANTYTATNLSATTYYRVVVQNVNCAVLNSTTTFVSPAVVAGTISGGNGYCSTTNNTTFTLSGNTGAIVRWESCLSPAFSSGVTNIANNTNSLNIINATVTTYYRVLINSGSISCAGAYSNIDSIVIFPPSVGGTVSGNYDTVCVGNNSITLTLSGYTGIIQWQTSITSATTGFSNIIGATAPTYIANNLSVKTYFRAIVTSGVCSPANSAVDSVVINSTPVGGTVSGSNDTVCTGTNSTTLTITGYTGAIQWQSSTISANVGFSNISGANAATYIANNISVKTYFRAVFTNGSCPSSASAVDSVLVHLTAVGGNISGADSVCSGNNSTLLTLSGFTGSIIRWESANNPAFTGIITQISNTTTTHTVTNLSATTYFRAVLQNGNCPLAYSSVKAVIVVSPSFGGFITAPSTVCINTNSTILTITSYTGTILRWESSTTSNFSGTVTTIPHTGPSYTVNNISTPMYYRAVVQNGICPSVNSPAGFINVQVQPNPGNVVGGGNVCISSNSTLLTLVGYQGNIVRWESSNTFDFSGTITTITNTSTSYTATNLTTTTYYRAVVQYLNCATVNSGVAAITVVPISVGGTVTGSNDTVCAATNSTTLTVSGYSGTIQWQASTSSASSGFSNISSANAPSYVANNLSVKTYFRAIVTNGICPAQTSSVDSILINAVSVGGTVAGNNDTVCIGTNSTILTLTGYTGSIQWQSSTTSATTGFANIIGATAATFIANNLSVKTYYRAIVTNGICPAQTSTVDSVIVNSISVGGTVAGNNDTVCAGTNATTLTLTGYTGSIQWQSSTTSATTGFANIIGATAATFIANNLLVKTYYRAIVTNGVCPAETSTVDSILINSISVGGTVAGNNDTVCTGTNATILTLTDYTGSIQWQASTTSATTGFTNIIGATAATFIANNLSVKTYYRAIVTNGICPSQTSTVDSIVVNSISVGGTVAGNNDTVCTGTNSTTLTITGYTGSIQWQASTTSATTGFTNIIGATAATFIANNLWVKTYYRAIVTNGICPSQTSTVDSILINSISIGGTVAGNNDTVCTGTNATILTLTGYTGSIQWQSSITSATTGFANITGATAATYFANNLSVKTYYRAIVTNGICPAQTSTVDSILINSISVGGIVSSNHDTVCTGTNATTLTLTGYTGSIQWQASTSSASSGFSNISGANAPSYVSNNLSIKTYYRAVVTNGICPAQISSVDSILINLPIASNTISSSQTICSGSIPLAFTGSTPSGGNGSNYSFSWLMSTVSGNTGFTVIGGAVNKDYTSISLTQQTWFKRIVSSGVCSQDTSNAIIISTTNPITNNIISGAQNPCSGDTPTTLTGSIPLGGNHTSYSYTWLSSNISSSMGFTLATGINNTANHAPSSLTQNTWFKRVVSSGACPSDTSNPIQITVNNLIVYSYTILPITIVYGSTIALPTTITVKYSDSTSSVRPVTWDTSGYNNNVGTYQYYGTILLEPGTCNRENIRGSISITIIPREITYKAKDDFKLFGTVKIFNSSGSAVNLINGTLVSGHLLTAVPVSSAGSIAPAPVGTYPIIIDSFNLVLRDASSNDVTANYKIFYEQGILNVVNRMINLSVEKNSQVRTITAGDSLIYTITITNNGVSTLNNGETINIIEQPNPGLTIFSYTPSSGSYNSTSNTLTLSGPFSPNNSITLTVRGIVTAAYDKDSIENAVLIKLPTDVTNLGDSTDTVYVHTNRLVDLSIRKVADKLIAEPSDTINYTIAVKNNGPGRLFKNEHLTITDFLPDSFINVSASTMLPIGSSYNLSSGEFILGDTLNIGDSILINVNGIIHPQYKNDTFINCVKLILPNDVKDTSIVNDTAWVISTIKQPASPVEIIVDDQIICKGNIAKMTVTSTGIINPIYTWYADSLLTFKLGNGNSYDTLLLNTAYFYVTVKGDNKLENIPGNAKAVKLTVHDYASDTMIVTNDTSVCYGKPATLIASPRGPITNPVFTWYALPSLTIPIATGDTFNTGGLLRDTLYYVTIKGSNFCESRELHIVRVTIKRNCGNPRIGLSKALTQSSIETDGSYNLSFMFIAANTGDEDIVNVKMEDDLKPVFPNAQITVLSLTTPGNWILNLNYDGVTNTEMLGNGNRLNIGQRDTLQLALNIKFAEDDTTTSFKNVAEVKGNSEVSGKPMDRKSQDGLTSDSTSINDSNAIPTPIVINRIKPKTVSEIFIPDGFSPNGDNVNDYFVIENTGKYNIYFAVVNRWGNLLYENEKYDNSWDGKAKKGIIVNEGEGVPDGTYFCIVEYLDEKEKRIKLAKAITIAR